VLEVPFTEEIKKAIFKSYSDGAPRPDGLSFTFYQKFWHVVKDDLMKLFQSFYEGSLDIFRINFSNITLISEDPNACTINKFRSISLLNCSYKIFTKVLTNRINLASVILN
jgi:hypothetical protein